MEQINTRDSPLWKDEIGDAASKFQSLGLNKAKEGNESEYKVSVVVSKLENSSTDTILNNIDIETEGYSDNDTDDDDNDDEYEMNRNPCGKCIIFNNTFATRVKMEDKDKYLSYRGGTDFDAKRLGSVFQRLKFRVVEHTDREKREMEDILTKESSDPEHYSMNCLVVCILSHGKEGGIYTADGKFIKFQAILDIFCGDQSKPLLGKPKLFFVQACQGEVDGRYVGFDGPREPVEDYDYSYQEEYRKVGKGINVNADQFLFLSATPGNVSWRSSKKGSWFIQTMCKVFEKYAKRKKFNELILKINKRISKKAEVMNDSTIASMMSTVDRSTLTKVIRFYPDERFKSNQAKKL